ncbi:SGNH/GDSL hydrolase family protein [Devosia sp. PTR5]|uniref:SGNH/GDSL hydrolase family protein n=1 Tax=Devosia oryzisoli TaxID=2774138 RepID=A0A927FR07_9HYPH|nr:SGNH/GDSL hydrolase family protein [Devosia oryzisoli]MBD8064655.1 SGNH/GDSL hydrolase family protein [Devosia oryzisoli]
MKTILAYGDSLTFGSNPEPGGARHAYEDRWPSVVETSLAGKARVIAEGLGGRTTAFDDFSAPADRNGVRVLPTLLDSHKPLDLVIIMLGTNDLKVYLNGTAFGAAMGMKRLVQIIKSHPYDPGMVVPQVIMVAPPLTVETTHADLHPMFAPRADEAKLFDFYYSRIARELDVGYFNAASVAVADPRDGVHLDPANTRAIGEGLAPLVKQTLGL